MKHGRIIRIAAFKALAILSYGCVHSHAHVSAPSTAAVQGGINSAQNSNAQAQRYNDVARGLSGRIDAKAGVLSKYWGTAIPDSNQ